MLDKSSLTLLSCADPKIAFQLSLAVTGYDFKSYPTNLIIVYQDKV